jgi:DNA-binding MarR family transcriptional regulator
LQDKGLVERVSVENDRRAQQLSLTPAGRSLVPKLAAIADQNDEDFFGILADTDRRRLMELMKRLIHKHGLKQVPVA